MPTALLTAVPGFTIGALETNGANMTGLAFTCYVDGDYIVYEVTVQNTAPTTFFYGAQNFACDETIRGLTLLDADYYYNPLVLTGGLKKVTLDAYPPYEIAPGSGGDLGGIMSQLVNGVTSWTFPVTPPRSFGAGNQGDASSTFQFGVQITHDFSGGGPVLARLRLKFEAVYGEPDYGARHVNNIDWPPMTTIVPPDDDGRDHLATLQATAAENTVFRLTNVLVEADQQNPYYSITAYTPDDSYDLNDNIFDGEYTFQPSSTGDLFFTFDTSGAPPNQGGSYRIGFDVHIEYPQDSGTFVPLTDEHAVIVFEGDEIMASIFGGDPDPGNACFWTDLMRVVQSACDMPDPPPENGDHQYLLADDNNILFCTRLLAAEDPENYNNVGGALVVGDTIRFGSQGYEFSALSAARIDLTGMTLVRYPRTETGPPPAEMGPVPDTTLFHQTVTNWPDDNGLIGRFFEGAIDIGITLDPQYLYFFEAEAAYFDANDTLLDSGYMECFIFDPAVDGVMPDTIEFSNGTIVTASNAGMLAIYDTDDNAQMYVGVTYRGDGPSANCQPYAVSSPYTGPITVDPACS